MPEISQSALEAASFAQSVAEKHLQNGGSALDLFVAYAGIVATRDQQVSCDCLLALDAGLDGSLTRER